MLEFYWTAESSEPKKNFPRAAQKQPPRCERCSSICRARSVFIKCIHIFYGTWRMPHNNLDEKFGKHFYTLDKWDL